MIELSIGRTKIHSIPKVDNNDEIYDDLKIIDKYSITIKCTSTSIIFEAKTTAKLVEALKHIRIKVNNNTNTLYDYYLIIQTLPNPRNKLKLTDYSYIKYSPKDIKGLFDAQINLYAALGFKVQTTSILELSYTQNSPYKFNINE